MMVMNECAGEAPDHRPPEPRAQSGPGSLRVLVVEDNPVNQRVAVLILERHGHRVEVAGDGREALALLELGRFDVVLMDLQMPVMDGFEATRAIRLREPADRHLPVIALTANALASDQRRCLEIGFDDFLTKPIRWPILKQALELRAGLAPPPPLEQS